VPVRTVPSGPVDPAEIKQQRRPDRFIVRPSDYAWRTQSIDPRRMSSACNGIHGSSVRLDFRLYLSKWMSLYLAQQLITVLTTWIQYAFHLCIYNEWNYAIVVLNDVL